MSSQVDYLSTDGLRVPEHVVRIDLLLQRQQLSIQRIAVVQLVRGRSIVARIDVIQVRAEVGLGLRLDNSVVEAVDEVCRRGGVAVVLEDPQAVTVVVSGEGDVLGVDGRAGTAVQVDDGIVLG